ncbi:hypothetical protein C8A01DRAFT_13403 [Parachaetomium inaequale]|uniref:Uncharacterized protein n=1 Tax=Parachaetomium inaequale TaxID=2588326 RepID=A0AAN6SUZ7_9PEZI|nr:hypothetical protein C8A01DRAFT_13403 [Parachaetomium inaequale]
MIIVGQVFVVVDFDFAILGDIYEVVDGHPGLAVLVQPVGVLALQNVVEAGTDERHRLLGGAQHVNRVSHRVGLRLNDGLVGQRRERRQEGGPGHQEGVDEQRLADIQRLQYVFLRDGIGQAVVPVDGADDAVPDRIQKELRGAHDTGALVRVAHLEVCHLARVRWLSKPSQTRGLTWAAALKGGTRKCRPRCFRMVCRSG